jgi:hypothetical protein
MNAHDYPATGKMDNPFSMVIALTDVEALNSFRAAMSEGPLRARDMKAAVKSEYRECLEKIRSSTHSARASTESI